MADVASVWTGYKPESFRLLALVEGDEALDVGCGTGEDARALAAVAGGVSVVGIDASEEKIRQARAAALGLPRPVDFRVADACALPWEKASFDACRADRLFHHLTDPEQALGEMIRVARPGARIAVSDTDYETLVVQAADAELTRRIVGHHTDRMESGRIGRRLRGLFLDAGLGAVAVYPYVAVITADDEDVLKLRDKARRAVEAGVIRPEEAARWVADLETADRAGRFFCALTWLTVVGWRR